MSEENNIYRDQRLQKADAMREKGISPYPNDVNPQHLAQNLMAEYDPKPAEAFEQITETFSLAGRVMAVRSFGKAAFVQLQDRSGRFQIFIQKTSITETEFEIFKTSCEIPSAV